MTMYPAAAEETIRKLDELKPHIKDMTGRSPGFIQDQIDRAEKYGASTRWSPAQLKWINELHDRYIGTDDPVDRDDEDEGPDAPDLEFAPR